MREERCDGVSEFDWRDFLEQWSKEALAASDAHTAFPQDVVQSGWLGNSGASEEQIKHAEARLGTTLPPSYRTFLATSNGWRIGDTGDQLWSIEEVAWFADKHQDWVDIWVQNTYPVADDQYFVYDGNQDTAYLRPEYLQTALEISPLRDEAVYLLNPRVVTAEGEWEVLFFANWLPGAARYRSFKDMMQTIRSSSR